MAGEIIPISRTSMTQFTESRESRRVPITWDLAHARATLNMLIGPSHTKECYEHYRVDLANTYASYPLEFQSGLDFGLDFVPQVLEMVGKIEHILDQNDDTVRMIEGIGAFLIRCTKMATVSDLVLDLTSLSHALFPGVSFTKKFQTLVVAAFKRVFQPHGLRHQSLSDEENLDWAAEILAAFRDKFDLFTSLKELPLMTKLHKFLLYCLSNAILVKLGIDFDTLGYNKFEAAAIKKAHSSKLGFMHCLFDALSLFCQQFVASVKIGSFEPFHHTGTAYVDWFDMVTKLKKQEAHLGDPEPHGFSIFSFRSDLHTALERGRQIEKACKGSPKVLRERIRSMIAELEVLSHNDISRKSAQRDRASPFGVLFSGGSSLGKSTLINVAFQYMAARFKLPNDSSAKYTRNPGEKYWNNFNTSCWCIVMDDIAAQSPSLGVEDPSLREIIGVMNNVAYQPDQASIEDKGRTPVQAKFVVGTTNTEHLNASAFFSCPLAVQRRFPVVVEVHVKPQHALNNMLDHTQLFRAKGQYPDYWNLIVKKVVPETDDPGCRKGKTVVIEEFSDISQFLAWMGNTAQTHYSVQDLIGKEALETADITVCDRCCYPSYHCCCDHDAPEEVASDLHQPLSPEEVVRTTRLPTIEESLNEDDSGSEVGELEGVATLEHQSLTIELPGWEMERWWNWTSVDTASLLYTVYSTIWGLLCGMVWSMLGPIFLVFYGAPFAASVFGMPAERMFLRFLLRRVGDAVQDRYAPLIGYSKVFAMVAIATYGGGYIMTQVAKRVVPQPVLVCAACGQKADVIYYAQVHQVEAVKAMAAEAGLSPQADTHSGKAPEAETQERTNVWYKEDFNVCRFDINDLSSSWKALPKDTVRSKVRNNCLRVDISAPGVKSQRTGMVALGGHLYAINSHALPDVPMLTMDITRTSENGVNTNHKCIVVSTQVVRSTTTDIAYIALRGMSPFKDLTRLVPKISMNGRYDGEYVGLESDHTPFNRKLALIKPEVIELNGLKQSYFGAESDIPTELGNCGAVMVAWSPFGPLLCGIHSLGSPVGVVKAARLIPEDIEHAREVLKATRFESSEPMLNAPSAPFREIVELDKKSVFRYVESGSARVYGSLSGPRHSSKSAVTRTLMAENFERLGMTQKFGPPQMRGWKPWRTAVLPMLRKDAMFRQDIIDEATASFTADILRLLPLGTKKTVHVYDMFTAINGAPGVAYVDAMKRSTSAGFPWCTSKKKFLVALEPREGLSEPMDITPEIAERVEKVFECYRQGRRFSPVFNGNLKDEPVKWKKVEAGKTRVFCGAPMDWSIAGRMLFLPIIRLMQNHRFIFESAPGTVAQSPEWGEIYSYLTSDGDLMIAGDFGDFDKGMLATFILSAFKIMTEIARWSGNYSEGELNAMEGIAIDTAYAFVNFNGDLTEFLGSNPSGSILTVVINGLVNCLYMRYCYIVLNPEHECRTFKDYVKLMTYGDDNVMGVHPDCPWFNHTAIQEVLANHGVRYTMADKESESVPYISIKDVSFLKRTWRFDEDVGYYLCPLDFESIEKSLLTCVTSTSVSQGEQAVSIMSSAYFEFFFYGKEKFHEMAGHIFAVIAELGLERHAKPTMFPTWMELRQRYHPLEEEVILED